jgi:hypothetical protein
MTTPRRFAAKLILVLQIPFAYACSGTGPGGPGDPADARFAGLLTVTEEPGADASGPAFRGPAPLAGARVELVAGGQAVAGLQTGPTGAFTSTVPSGAYSVRIAMSEGAPLEFALELPPRAALFAEGRVDRSTGGTYTLNVRVFRDGNADARPDDAFHMQILDRVQGDEESGFEDVVTTAAEAASAVTLCHVPPGNPDAAHTVTVGASAVPAHLAHGDAEGVCEEAEPPVDDGEDEAEDDGEVEVLVCHVPPGNPETPHTIEVGESAVPAHLAHGDTEGACEGDTEEPGDDAVGEDDAEDEEQDDEGQVKVLVCHVPPGNPENPVTIEVAEPALPAHLDHGDTEGACAEETPPADGVDEGGEGEGEG